jgi:hypothetical protein
MLAIRQAYEMAVIPYILGISLIYTALAFSGELSRKQNSIFSRNNANPWQLILAIHAAFLSVLTAVVLLLGVAAPNLPGWTTENIGRGVTPLDALLLIVMLILRPIEKGLIYREAPSGAL